MQWKKNETKALWIKCISCAEKTNHSGKCKESEYRTREENKVISQWSFRFIRLLIYYEYAKIKFYQVKTGAYRKNTDF